MEKSRSSGCDQSFQHLLDSIDSDEFLLSARSWDGAQASDPAFTTPDQLTSWPANGQATLDSRLDSGMPGGIDHGLLDQLCGFRELDPVVGPPSSDASDRARPRSFDLPRPSSRARIPHPSDPGLWPPTPTRRAEYHGPMSDRAARRSFDQRDVLRSVALVSSPRWSSHAPGPTVPRFDADARQSAGRYGGAFPSSQVEPRAETCILAERCPL